MKPNGETRVVLHLHPKLAPDPGRRVPPRQEGRDARARPRDLRVAARHVPLPLRRGRHRRQALRPHGRGGHAVRDHRRQPEPRGRRPSPCATATRRSRSACTSTSCSATSASGSGTGSAPTTRRSEPRETSPPCPAAVSSRPALLVALLAVALATAGCGSTTPPKDTRVSTVASSSPGEFASMRGLLVKLGRLQGGGRREAAARALFGEVLAEGKGLLVMKPPSDLRREDVVPRFLEGRAAFGDALNAYGRDEGRHRRRRPLDRHHPPRGLLLGLVRRLPRAPCGRRRVGEGTKRAENLWTHGEPGRSRKASISGRWRRHAVENAVTASCRTFGARARAVEGR